MSKPKFLSITSRDGEIRLRLRVDYILYYREREYGKCLITLINGLDFPFVIDQTVEELDKGLLGVSPQRDEIIRAKNPKIYRLEKNDEIADERLKQGVFDFESVLETDVKPNKKEKKDD